MSIKKAIRSSLFQGILSPPLIWLYDLISKPKTLGARGEREAERFLLRQGLVIVARGYQDKFGEIDLIAVDDRTLVFVEVKTRSSDLAGLPAEAVDERKQQHITRTAQGFLKWQRLTDCRVRFDVISILWPDPDSSPILDHYPSAFEAAGDYQLY